MQDMVRNMNEIKRAGMAEWFWERLKILKASAFSRTGKEQNSIRWQRSVGKEFGVNMVGKGKTWKALNMTITWVEYTLQVKRKVLEKVRATWGYFFLPIGSGECLQAFYIVVAAKYKRVQKKEKEMYLRDIPRKKIIEPNNSLSLIESEKREQLKKKCIHDFWA